MKLSCWGFCIMFFWRLQVRSFRRGAARSNWREVQAAYRQRSNHVFSRPRIRCQTDLLCAADINARKCGACCHSTPKTECHWRRSTASRWRGPVWCDVMWSDVMWCDVMLLLTQRTAFFVWRELTLTSQVIRYETSFSRTFAFAAVEVLSSTRLWYIKTMCDPVTLTERLCIVVSWRNECFYNYIGIP